MNRRLACCSLAMWGLLSISSVLALEPIGDLNWCPGARDCLAWSPSPGATHYNIYRGAGFQLPAVLEGATDSCTVGSTTGTTTGAFADDTPQPDAMQWYVVGAVDDLGVENAGQATAGPRSVDSSGDCLAAVTLVLNEVDYDQVGSDQAEFVEIFNPGPGSADLASIVLIAVNGSTQSEYGRVQLSDAGTNLAPGGYLVVAAAALQATLPPGTPSAAFGSAGNNLQNGAPDGVALFDTASETLLDALSYEGSIVAATFDGAGGTFNLVEGAPTLIQDSNTTAGALCRLPDGLDTGDAASDWFFCGVLTPGAMNTVPLIAAPD